jgi:hypothetical protein
VIDGASHDEEESGPPKRDRSLGPVSIQGEGQGVFDPA